MTEEKKRITYACCGSSSSEPAGASEGQKAPLGKETIRLVVRERYGEIATAEMTHSGTTAPEIPSSPKEMGKLLGYSEGELESIPAESNLGLGCGNPVAIASIQPGETVVDLGSGAGIDCFLAAKKVGKAGKVIGVDMTPEMIDKARTNAQQGAYENVEFRLGEIEHMPIANDSADLVISNCVINLSPDKPQVFREAYRVLKPGGRMMISDIILVEELPDIIKTSLEGLVGCVSGAMMKEDYLEAIRAAGFEEITIIDEAYPADLRKPSKPLEKQDTEKKPKVIVGGQEIDHEFAPEEIEKMAKAILIVNVQAFKPGQKNRQENMPVPFKLNKATNHISVPIFVNGKGPFDFTLDTGATATTFSTSLADELGIETYDDAKKEARAIGIPHKVTWVESLKIGPESFEAEEVLVVDFNAILGPCGGDIKGLIGHSTLKNYRMSVNYLTNMLNLEKSISGKSVKDDEIHWSDFEYVDGTHMVGVPVFINGSGPFEFVVDTGAGGTVITPQLAEKLRLSQRDCEIQAVAVGGGTGGHLTTLDRLAVGSAVQEKAPVVVVDLKALTPRCGSLHNGILGYPFLKNYEMVIDYPNKKFALIDQ